MADGLFSSSARSVVGPASLALAPGLRSFTPLYRVRYPSAGLDGVRALFPRLIDTLVLSFDFYVAAFAGDGSVRAPSPSLRLSSVITLKDRFTCQSSVVQLISTLPVARGTGARFPVGKIYFRFAPLQLDSHSHLFQTVIGSPIQRARLVYQLLALMCTL